MPKKYITASIPYVNAKPHIGHALEFVQGDVLARHYKQKGDDVYYISGADENSLKVVQAAEKADISVQEFADKNAVHFENLIKEYNISINKFQRSSSREHHASSQELWKRCEAAGDIYKKKYKGLYCVGCETFYKKEELNENGECLNHLGKPVQEVEEENYFFALSKYQDKLKQLIESDQYLVRPHFKKNEVLSFIEQGLEDFSISRSKERARDWGVLVPGDETQIMYVWFDALNVYRSAAPDYWPADLHIIGKDIIRFHAIYWPAILLSAELELPKELFVHGFITIDGQKMSKSIGNVVDPFELVQKYGIDPVRYYLLREIPADNDGDFSEEKFIGRYNADLANGLGNFVSRVATLADGQAFKVTEIEDSFTEKIISVEKRVKEYLEEKKFHDALAILWELISFGDSYLNEKEPWKVTDEKEKKKLLNNLLSIIVKVQELIAPFLPETAKKIRALLDEESGVVTPQKPESSLFPRL